MDIVLPGLIIFVFTVCIIELLRYAVQTVRNPDRAALKKRLKSFAGPSKTQSSIMRSDSLSDIPWFHRLLSFTPGLQQLEQLRRQAGVSLPLGFFLLLSATLGLIGYLVLFSLTGNNLQALAALLVGALLPLFFLKQKKKKRIERFQHQLPEALDLIARSLRAGHAFSAGLKLASQQFDDPVGSEFAKVIDEINFGLGVQEALRNLAQRIDSPELKFFIVAVILQRETGGNLAAIMEANASLIRERFKFQNHVRTLTAEGKYSAVILILLPVFLACVIYFMNPEYILILFIEEIGRIMLLGMGILMVIGIMVIRKMINIQP